MQHLLKQFEDEIGTGVGGTLVRTIKTILSTRDERTPRLYKNLYNLYEVVEAHYKICLSSIFDSLVIEIAGTWCQPRLLKILGSAELRFVSVELFQIESNIPYRILDVVKDYGLTEPIRASALKDSKRLNVWRGIEYVQAYKHMGWSKIPAYIFPHSIYMNDLMSLDHINLE